MANLFEETVVDFDLNFLQPIHNVNNLKHEKQRQSIVNMKNKIIKSHCLVQKYYLQKDRLEETESLLLASKEECKQACLDYKVTLEKCIQLEKDAQNLTDINRELESKIINLDNQCQAMKSHAHQLQLLVKEHESIIQALNIEKQLEKNTFKESEKKLIMLEKERDVYLKDIKWMRDVILGKRKSKSCNSILNKYKKLLNSEDKPESDKSDDDSCFDDSPPGSPLNGVDRKQEVCFSGEIEKRDIEKSENNNLLTDKDDNDSDCCNEEVVSEDTGRGSSLAFSDADKFLNSPDTGYCIADRHQKIINKENIIQVDVGTSPIRFEENIVHPNICGDEATVNENNTTKSPEYFITDFPVSTEIVTTKEKKQLFDASTSPIPRHFYMRDNSTSPIVFDNVTENHSNNFDSLNIKDRLIREDAETKASNINTPVCHMNNENLLTGSELEISTDQPKISSVETNKIASDDTDNDLEVETILNKMRFRHTLISPIPKTPKKLHKDKIKLKDSKNPGHMECPDALKMKEENKALHANISFLCKEIMLIKKMLNTKMPENFDSTLHNSNVENILGESSRDTLVICNSERRQIDSEGVYHTTDNNSNTALSKFVDNGPINTNNIDEHQLKQQAEKSKIIRETRTKEKEHCKEVSTEPFYCADDTDIHVNNVDGNEKEDKDKKWLQPTTNENDCRNHHNSEIRVMTSDDDDNSHGPQICNNQLDTSNHLSNVDEEDASDVHEVKITDSIPQNTQNYNPSENRVALDFTNSVETMDEISTAVTKSHKLTKLDKFKKKIMPKSKISRLSAPNLRKLKKRTRVIPVSNLNKRNNPSQILNNRAAYDKALKVMTEINLKSNHEKKKIFHRPNGKLLNSQCESTDMSTNSQNKCILRKDDEDNLRPMNPKQPSSPTIEEPSMSTTDRSSETSESNDNNDNDEVNCNQIKTSSSLNVEENPKDSNEHDKTECETQIETKSPKRSRRRKRVDSNESNISCKRMLRSSNVEKEKLNVTDNSRSNNVIDYTDIDVFSTNSECTVEKENILTERIGNNRINSEQLFNCNSNPEHVRRSKRLSSNISDSNNLLLCSYSDSLNHAAIIKDHKRPNAQVYQKQGKVGTDSQSNEDNPSLMGKVSTSSIESTLQGSKRINTKFEEKTSITSNTENTNNLGDSILCKMIVKYGKTIIRHTATKVSDNLVNSICKKIETSISNIIELSSGPDKIQEAINELVEDMKKYNKKSLLAGLMNYLQDPARKLELYNKVNCHPSMAMTKREQVILSALQKLNNTKEYKIVNDLLNNIEFTLFRLNKTPEFDTIESLSHFYAVTCRLFHLKYRLKTFLLDAMYCLQYKAVIIIKQCLTTWTHILPLAHMKYAKSPLITCIVYLLHFYKCEDRFNRVQNIRWILNKKYFYTFSEWNETKILEMFGNAIRNVKDDPAESNMLRLALLIFGKRHGPKWCQRNVINNMLLPMIEDEKTPEKVKKFCIKALGPLLKPYPGDMKVHCEIIVNQLLDMLDQKNLTHGVKEAIITSLIYMSKHNPARVTKALLSWHPDRISPELENLLKSYVQEKPIKAWKTILSKTYI